MQQWLANAHVRKTWAFFIEHQAGRTIDNKCLKRQLAGYDMSFWFPDARGRASSALQLVQFRILLDKIRDGATLLVSKLDRLGRDAQDIGATVKNADRAPYQGHRPAAARN